MRFNVRCAKSVAEQMAERVKAERALEKQWWQDRYDTRPKRLTAARRAAWLAAAQAAYEAEVAVGRLAGTRSAVLLPAVRAELTDRDWLTRAWRPVPAGYRTRKARPWGATDQHWRARITVDLPDDLAEMLVRACYWTSAPHVAALQRWYDQHGEQHRGTSRGGRIWTGAGPSNADLERRDQLQDSIVTTGRVLRTALCRALDIDPTGKV